MLPRSKRTVANDADRESFQRLVAARDVLDAVVTGQLYATPDVLDAVTRVMAAAARWAWLAEEPAA